MTEPSEEERYKSIGVFMEETTAKWFRELMDKCERYEKVLALVEEVRKARKEVTELPSLLAWDHIPDEEVQKRKRLYSQLQDLRNKLELPERGE